ncbi:hypothetical protein [Streptomyces sp. NPDC052042]|uniref:hypothetical protein n=1 Tax=Streptomyces sp. NPDC052042 TaxID=3365683 RepID=UPI0037CD0C86
MIINPTNVARAAMRKADRVIGSSQDERQIPFDYLTVRACFYDGADVDELIDRLATRIKPAVHNVLRQQ